MVDRALDLVFSTIDDLCINKDYETVNRILALPGLPSLPTDLLLGVITITRHYRHRLPNRAALCVKAREVFNSRGEPGDLLMKNLDLP